jgi:predicted nuclease with TOPRIM domain
MANDANKPPEDPKETPDAEKHLSLIEQAMALIKKPELQAGFKALSSLISGKDPSEAQKILDDLKTKNDERVKKIADLQAQLKANEGKIAANNEILQKSRDAVAKLGEERKQLDAEGAALDAKIAETREKLKQDDLDIQKAKDKIAATDAEIAAQKAKNKQLEDDFNKGD